MTTTELLSLLQFNQRWAVRTLPSGLSTVADRQHLLGLYAGIEAVEEVGEARYLGTADIEPKYLGTAGISRAYDGTASIGPTYLGTAGVNQ